MNDTGARPLGERVMVRRDEAQTLIGLIHAPQGSEQWPQYGTVLAIGAGVQEESITVGCRVIFKPQPASALWWDDRMPDMPLEWDRVVVLKLENILCVVED